MSSSNINLHASFTDSAIPKSNRDIVRTSQLFGNIPVYKYHNSTSRNDNAIFRSRVCPDPECLDCIYAHSNSVGSSTIKGTEVSRNESKTIEPKDYVLYFPIKVNLAMSKDPEVRRELLDNFVQRGVKVLPTYTEHTGMLKNRVFDPVSNSDHLQFLNIYMAGNVQSVSDTTMRVSLRELYNCVGFESFTAEFSSRLPYLIYSPTSHRRVMVSLPVVTIPYEDNFDRNRPRANAELILRIISIYAQSKRAEFIETFANLDNVAVTNLHEILNKSHATSHNHVLSVSFIDNVKVKPGIEIMVEMEKALLVLGSPNATTEEKNENQVRLDTINMQLNVPALKITFTKINATGYLYVYNSGGVLKVYTTVRKPTGDIKLIRNKKVV